MHRQMETEDMLVSGLLDPFCLHRHSPLWAGSEWSHRSVAPALAPFPLPFPHFILLFPLFVLTGSLTLFSASQALLDVRIHLGKLFPVC